MILNSTNYSDQMKMLKYGKTKGMVLSQQIFPKYSVYDQLIIFQTEEEWKMIKSACKNTFFLRADNIIGKDPVPSSLKGRAATKENALEFIREVKKKNGEFSIVYMEESEKFLDPLHLIYTHGAFNIYIYWDQVLYLDYVCPFFDASNLTKGQIIHESYAIPFQDILFVNGKNIHQYQKFRVTPLQFQEQWKRRELELLKERLEHQKLIQSLNPTYSPCPDNILNDIVENICIYLLSEKAKILSKTGKNFGIQGNINQYDDLEIYEINRLERMIKR